MFCRGRYKSERESNCNPRVPFEDSIKLHQTHNLFLELVTSILFATRKIFETFAHLHKILKYFLQPLFATRNYCQKNGGLIKNRWVCPATGIKKMEPKTAIRLGI